MDELTPAHVHAQAGALGLSLTDGDAVEIAHRLNAFVQALAPLGTEPLLEAEPLPLPPP